MNAGQMMTWEDFKLKFSKYHVPQGLIKKMRDEFRELKQGRMSVVEYRDRFLTLSRLSHTDGRKTAPSQREPQEKDDEPEWTQQCPEVPQQLLWRIHPKIQQANHSELSPQLHQQQRRTPKPGGNNNNNKHHNPNNNNNHPNGNHNNPNTAPRTGSNAVPVNPKDKSTVNCYECGVVGHFSNECPKKLARIAANTAAPAQQQRRFAGRKNQNNSNGRLYHMTATEAQEAPQTMPTACPDAPRNAHARQDAHGDAPERARASPRPVDSALPSTSPFTCSFPSTSGTKWTRSPDLARPVAVVTDDDCPPRYSTRASRSCSLQTTILSAFKRVVIPVT
ncbi:hypothetical protein QYE76_001164 [Lolium multiflorum]|uniref:CCHC-type domain-containing protein n=1 Tax=Lolium multiflorum TaxID=4521 RepID=A0AAD8RKN2_LOLMU|nr:hypothetical protein QYE76_001164 [Lolium multiflorum]